MCLRLVSRSPLKVAAWNWAGWVERTMDSFINPPHPSPEMREGLGKRVLTRDIRDLAFRTVGLQFDDVLGKLFQVDLLGAHAGHVHACRHALDDAWEVAVTRVSLRTDDAGFTHLQYLASDRHLGV